MDSSKRAGEALRMSGPHEVSLRARKGKKPTKSFKFYQMMTFAISKLSLSDCFWFWPWFFGLELHKSGVGGKVHETTSAINSWDAQKILLYRSEDTVILSGDNLESYKDLIRYNRMIQQNPQQYKQAKANTILINTINGLVNEQSKEHSVNQNLQ